MGVPAVDDDDDDRDDAGELEISAKVLRKAIREAFEKGRQHQSRKFDELLRMYTDDEDATDGY